MKYTIYESSEEFEKKDFDKIEAGCTYNSETATATVVKIFDDKEGALEALSKKATSVRKFGKIICVIEYYVLPEEKDEYGDDIEFYDPIAFSEMQIPVRIAPGYENAYEDVATFDNYADAAAKVDSLLDEDIDAYIAI